MDLANGNPAGNENGSNSSHSDEVQVAGDVEDAAASESRWYHIVPRCVEIDVASCLLLLITNLSSRTMYMLDRLAVFCHSVVHHIVVCISV